ncbi:filamentous hemagglutinin family outer membrane protein [Kalymmatonema gypsitolerans NIES-4073]|nr:filamentous hemagglutinin family outer membrane protein [Scytonema sp. NIES-4073]
MSRISNRWGALLGIAIGGVSVWANCALAQITPDGTLPNNSNVTREGNNFNITGGTQAASNLFHSFKEFSVPTGSTAFFNNAADIQNIISRVTGGSVSNIHGLIKANGTANVFLINPNGIIFGPNAKLDIGGSFIASTASSINFEGGIQFSAKPSQNPPLLTITAPLGLNMGTNPGKITVQGPRHEINYDDFLNRNGRDNIDTTRFTGLEVKPGKTLALVGGNVSLEGGVLTSPGGRIEIGSFDSNQVVNLTVQEGWKLGYEATPSFGDIQFSDKALVNTTGDGSGSIAIAGGNINFTKQSILLADTLGDKKGQDISIVGKQIVFEQSAIGSNTFGSGDTGDIKLNATNIKFQNRSSASIQTANRGKAGNIYITANSMSMDSPEKSDEDKRTAIASITQKDSTGIAGDINIEIADRMEINRTGIATNALGTGNAGTINISANSFSSEISGIESSVSNTGKPGEIKLNVAGLLKLEGTGVKTNTSGTANAGTIKMNANSLLIENSQVNSLTGENSTGNAGEIYVTAESLKIINPDNNANPVGIFATSRTGKAGNINLQIGNLLLLRGKTSISTTAGTDKLGGNGGNIRINAPNGFIVAVPNENSDITANAYTGKGGSVKVNASGIYGTQFREKENPQTSDITVSSEFGVNGTVELNTPDIDPNTGLVNLPSVPVDTEVAQGCNSPNYAQSSFIITGRGGLPPNPKDILTPDAVLVDWVTLNPNIDNRKSPSVFTATKPTPEPIVEATGWVINAKGEVVLTADAPTTTPRSSWQTSAKCRT